MGKLARIKTTENDASVETFINQITDEQQREDSKQILQLMASASGETAKMWGASIIGFGNKRYVSKQTGREVDWMNMGFSPRKAALTLYLVSGLQKHEADLLRLGKHKTGAGCLYIKRLSDVNLEVLGSIIRKEAKS